MLVLLLLSLSSQGAVKKGRSPSDFLKSVLGRPIRVKLNSGIEYRGVLACLDGYLNIAMEQTEEFVDGQLKAKYGDAFLRGNNGT
jgi:U6 snRNA-associated Sm-like protein LSm6